MNVFIISPGRTATTSLAKALDCVIGFTASHESRCKYLGAERINYHSNHIELDNRLVWFLPRLTKKYSKTGILVILHRNRAQVAKSYNKRYYAINIMTAYSQGILMRDFSQNGMDVCKDYVENVYEHLNFFSEYWNNVVHLDLESPEKGLKELLFKLNRLDDLNTVLNNLNRIKVNLNQFSLRNRIYWLWYAVRFVWENIKLAFSLR